MNSEYQKIKGTKNYYVTADGYIFKKTGNYSFRKLSISTNKTTGYDQVIIRGRTGKWRTERVHQLVAEAFCKRPRYVRNLEVNHADGKKRNNSSCNLIYASHLENMRHAWAAGLCDKVVPAIRKKRAELNGQRSELSDIDVRSIRKLRSMGFKLRELGYIYNLHPVNVCAICNHRTFKNV